MSLGLRLEREAGAEAEFVVYAGGWVDVGLVAPGGDQVVQEYVELEAGGDLGALLDRVVDHLVG
jgi:hypothetical protein